MPARPPRQPSTPAPGPPVNPPTSAGWYIPAIVAQLPDGSTLVKPGRAVRRGTAAQVAHWTGVGRKTLAKLAEAGLISRAQPSRGIYWYFPAEVEALIQSTIADPAWWETVRTKAHLKGRNLRSC